MLPSVVASELEQVAGDAIRTAFHPTTSMTPCLGGRWSARLPMRRRLIGVIGWGIIGGFGGFLRRKTISLDRNRSRSCQEPATGHRPSKPAPDGMAHSATNP